jgi:acetyl-CoA C-acetyltransferase
LGASGVRLTLTAARAAKASGLNYSVASACAGGGQGVAVLLENI